MTVRLVVSDGGVAGSAIVVSRLELVLELGGHPPIGQPEQPADDRQRGNDQKDLVPAALMGNDRREADRDAGGGARKGLSFGAGGVSSRTFHGSKGIHRAGYPSQRGIEWPELIRNTLNIVPETSPIAETELKESGSPVEAATDAAAGALYDAVADVVKIIRPAVQADNGDIFLRDVDEETGVVSVELVGACITCPASSQTLKQGLERILKQRVDGVTSVQHVGEALLGYDEGTAVSL